MPIRPKILAVLRYLIEHREQVVSRNELIQAIWPDRFGADAAPRQCILELRKLLGDSTHHPHFIETVGRHGYRFIGALEMEPHQISAPGSVGHDGSGSTPPEAHDPLRSNGTLAPDPSIEHHPPGRKPDPHHPLETASGSAHSFILPPGQGTPMDASKFLADTSILLGRDSESRQLEDCLALVRQGRRQVLFVTGEAGIGKTTLMEHFLARIADGGEIHVGMGQCVEFYGEGEAFLPIIEALGQMARAPDGGRVIEVLHRYAPSWLLQIPTLVESRELDLLRRDTQGITKGRMLRELIEGLEVLATERPVVMVLEDLHWSDPSTVEWLAMVARRPEAMRLLLVGTYRPVALEASRHSLQIIKQELVGKGRAVEMALDFLAAEVVQTFVARQLYSSAEIHSLGAFVYRRTAGHPLFMAQMTEYLARQGAEADHTTIEQVVPQDLRELIEAQIGRLSVDEQQVLEVASVAGAEFSVASVAVGVPTRTDSVETLCEHLARRGEFIEDHGLSVWPDGTVSGCYGFRHVLYPDVLRARMGIGQRARLHLAIGLRKAAGHGKEVDKIATELALHFEEGRHPRQAVHFLEQAARNALWRGAQQEALVHLKKALKILRILGDTKKRKCQELRLQIILGRTLMAIEGWAAPEAGNAYRRARELCQWVGASSELFETLMGLFEFHLVRGELSTALDLAEQMHDLADRVAQPDFRVRAETMLGMILFYLGRFPEAREHLETAISTYREDEHHPLNCGAVQDPRVASLSYLTSILWLCGYPDRALDETRKNLHMARKLAHPFSTAWSLDFAARLYLFRGEGQAAARLMEKLIAIATEHEFESWKAEGEIALGAALAEQGQMEKGIAHIHQGLKDSRNIGGPAIDHPFYYGLLAMALGQAGQSDEALGDLSKALERVDATEEHWYEAELHRLRGELILQRSKAKSNSAKGKEWKLETADDIQAETCFHEALAIARRQQARSLELRSVMSLARLWQRQGKAGEARQMLTDIFKWFSEGFDTRDLREAKALLATLV